MIFEFNILLNIIKTHLAGFSALIDAGLIIYVIYLRKELNKKADKEDLAAIKSYITDLFKHEINNLKEHTAISIDSLADRIKDMQLMLSR